MVSNKGRFTGKIRVATLSWTCICAWVHSSWFSINLGFSAVDLQSLTSVQEMHGLIFTNNSTNCTIIQAEARVSNKAKGAAAILCYIPVNHKCQICGWFRVWATMVKIMLVLSTNRYQPPFYNFLHQVYDVICRVILQRNRLGHCSVTCNFLYDCHSICSISSCTMCNT